MKQILNEILACPYCKTKLSEKNGGLVCITGKHGFNLKSDVPILFKNKLNKELGGAKISKGSYKDKLIASPDKIRAVKNITRVLGPPDMSLLRFVDAPKGQMSIRLKKFLEKLDKNAVILEIGSSDRRVSNNCINLDIDIFDNVDVVGDGAALPFLDKSFDAVILDSVLEHVDNPFEVSKEATRVLKDGGKIFVETPFLFVYHGSPIDCQRFSLDGHKALFRELKVLEDGVGFGPGSTLSMTLRYFLALMFSFNNEFAFSLFLNLFGWLTFPFKYLDSLLVKYKKAYVLAGTVYYIGKKQIS